MDLELSGRVAIVTGASRGIGKSVALELAREGVDVVVCARNREDLERSAGELQAATGRRVLAVPTDTTSRESVESMVESTVQAFGRIDILVNNAAYPGGLVQGPLAEAREEDSWTTLIPRWWGTSDAPGLWRPTCSTGGSAAS